MVATRKKLSTQAKRARKPKKPSKAELSRRAHKGIETRRRNAEALKQKKARAAEKRRETLRKKAAAKKKHVEAGKRGYDTRLAKERAAEAFRQFKAAVDRKAPASIVESIKRSWHKSKRELEAVVSFDRFMAILDDIADEEGSAWDIAYGSTESAA